MNRLSLLCLVIACGGSSTTTTATIAPVASASVTPQASASAGVALDYCSAHAEPGKGCIDPQKIREIVRAGNGRFQLCYESALKRNPVLAGRVETKFVIDITGHVESAEDATARDPLGDDEARACIVSKFKALEFPPPNPSVKMVVNYPLVFRPEDSDDPTIRASAGNNVRSAFNTGAAAAVIATVNVSSCAQTGFHGTGHVKITFDPSGVVTKAVVDNPPNINPAQSACISKAYGAAHITPFGGTPVTIGKSFNVP
jgi:hypothetical protein